MKYLDKKFSVYYTSDEYKNNWEKVFGKEEKKNPNKEERKEEENE